VAYGDIEVTVQARVSFVNDQIDSIPGWRPTGLDSDIIQTLLDFRKPGLVSLAGSLVQGWERSNYAHSASLDHQIGTGDKEHRRCDCGNGQAFAQLFGKGH
jgi:hypothetical protein